jgi:hypothetical protein
MKVTVNTLNQATPGAVISNVTIAPQSFVFGSNATYQNSNNNLTTADINGSAVSSTYTVTSAAIQAIQRNDGLTDPSTIVA